MNLKHLEIFKKIAENENLSLSAKELYIAQPALSRILRDIEDEFGYKLFDRVGKTISLNKNGEIVYRYVENLQKNLNSMKNELNETNSRESSVVNISFRVASKILPEILDTFYKAHQDISLKVFQINHPSKSLPEFDIIIDSVSEKELKDNSGKIILLKEDILMAIPKNNPLALKEEIFLNDLKDYSCTILNEFSSLGKIIRQELKEKGFEPEIIFESDNPFMIRDFLKLNLSYSFVPEKTWLIEKDFSNMVLKKIKDFNCSRNIYLSHGDREYISNSAREFEKHIREYFLKYI